MTPGFVARLFPRSVADASDELGRLKASYR